ncbi:nuclear transport factor 2 family protein [Robertkochia flava]|uniref:nuclear transport factor 2 family protein n=1 Tax=Robertkochia flava TaxID=3447986 RepID=UPI001CCFA134|nr:nuclear transport factor 2 family protein [Robertkochia marina]
MKHKQYPFTCLICTLALVILMGCKHEKSAVTPPDESVQTNQNIVQDSLTNFGKMYAGAWSSKDPMDLANFYSTNGILLDGDGISVTGRDSIAYISKIFHEEIPDMIVSLDSMADTANGIEFHWTLKGTNTRGVKIKMTGYEVMQIENGLITRSQGSYTNAAYEKIVQESSENKND